jgi:hypothetical protein
LSEDVVWDAEKGDLRVLGKRCTAIDVQSLCDYLNTLVGIQVAEVIMHNLEFRLGKLDAATLKAKKPGLGLDKLIEELIRSDQLSGLGITKVRFDETSSMSADIEVINPSVKGTTGAGKSFVFSYWAGALTALLDKEFDVRNVEYDQQKDVMKASIVQRDLPSEP